MEKVAFVVREVEVSMKWAWFSSKTNVLLENLQEWIAIMLLKGHRY